MPHKRGCRGGDCSPPQTPDAVRLDALTKQVRSARALGLQGGLESVDRGEGHPEAGSTFGIEQISTRADSEEQAKHRPTKETQRRSAQRWACPLGTDLSATGRGCRR